MTDDEKYVRARLAELSKRANARCTWAYSEFLTLAEQDMATKESSGDVTLWGGFEGAERKIAIFGSEELCGYACNMPIKTVKVQPASRKFADKLTHRDYLGALMSLGLKRNTIGDIIAGDASALIICLDSAAPYICDNLFQIKHTTVKCEITDETPMPLDSGEPEKFLTASERLDGIIAAVYKISRSESKSLTEQGRVFINSRLCTSPSDMVEEGSIVSVRGYGRFKYLGVARQTKKGKLSIRAICQR